jgi:hypothetical protein
MNREMCNQIQTYMKGVQTEKVWCRYRVFTNTTFKNRFPVRSEWGEWQLTSKREVITNQVFETIPCYSFLDMLGRVPNYIDTGGYRYYLAVIRHPNGTGSVDYRFRGKRLQWQKFKTVNDLPEALAKLILWLGEHSHLPKEVG